MTILFLAPLLGLTPPGFTMSPPFGGYDRLALSEPVPSASPRPSIARSGSLSGRSAVNIPRDERRENQECRHVARFPRDPATVSNTLHGVLDRPLLVCGIGVMGIRAERSKDCRASCSSDRARISRCEFERRPDRRLFAPPVSTGRAPIWATHEVDHDIGGRCYHVGFRVRNLARSEITACRRG
jgi:hypothetical protein